MESSEPVRGDLLNPECPTRHVIDVIGDRWTCVVVTVLGDGRRRFNDLARSSKGISYKMLTQTLRRLEREGLVSRTVYDTTPPKVEYELTDLGRQVLPVINAIRDWAEANLPQMNEARARFDRIKVA